jgi:hypothetical protein
MATYREIKGFTVQNLSTDPSLSSSNAGQVWFNSTTGKLKGLVAISGWASTTNLITAAAYSGGLGPTGAQDAMLVAGTYPPATTTCQEYNGSGWFTTASMNTARFSVAGGGTTTAAIMAGSGYPSTPTTITEEFDGTSWSEVNNIPVNHVYGAYAGTQTAFFAAGGVAGATTENYDGTSWTASGDMGRPNTSQMNAGMGTQTAGLAAGGTSASATTEEYDGSSWSSGGDLNTGRQYVTGAGTQTAALCIGGFISTPQAYLALTESYDGSAWTTRPAMATNRQAGQGGGTGSAAIAAGGANAGGIPTWNSVEVFNQSINVTTAGAWASGGTLGTGRQAFNGMGTSTAALVAGGEV